MSVPSDFSSPELTGEKLNDNPPSPLPMSVWSDALSELERELDPQVFAAYIEPLTAGELNSNDSRVTVKGPSRLVCNHVEANFRSRIEKILSTRVGLPSLRVELEVDSEARPKSRFFVVKKVKKPALASTSTPSESASRLPAFVGSEINPRYTFESFVVGNSNQFCHAAALQVADRPGQSYNPFFIYGGVGLGKTHLLHAIANQVRATKPDAKVLYISAETFTNELIRSLRNGTMDQFKRTLRTIEVLLIDDIQFMAGKERTQEEFFHTFNALYAAKRQIVITSDRLPQEISGIEDRLNTRFAWGLTADLQAPDFETRVAILNRKASQDGFSIPEDASRLIAEKIFSNVRELEGALTRLHAVSSLQSSPISLELTKSALKPLLEPRSIDLSIDDIKKVVCNHFGIKVSDIISKRRTRNLSFPRHIAMYLCRKHTTASYPHIGDEFGGRDHSSVIHAANVVSEKIKDDASLQTIMAELDQALFGGQQFSSNSPR